MNGCEQFGVVGEGVALHGQAADLAENKGFLFALSGVDADEIPHAGAVNEGVGL